MLITQSSMRASAAKHRNRKLVATAAGTRFWKISAAVISVALLSACAGTPSIRAGVASDEPGPQVGATPTTKVIARTERMRATTARDILLEWGVSRLGSKSRKKARTAGIAGGSAEMALSDYSASIQEIMANATCRVCEQKPYHEMVLQASNLYGVPSGLIHAVIQKESGYKPGARSGQNARGLMQVTPDTARFVGVENTSHLYDPQTNINAGTAYLKYLMRTHDTFDQVLAAYNAGPGNVRKYKGVPPFSETRRYVSDVKKFYAAMSRDML